MEQHHSTSSTGNTKTHRPYPVCSAYIQGCLHLTVGLNLLSAINLIPQDKYHSGNWNATLQCFVVNAEGLNVDTTLKCFPVAKSWGMGTGHYLDSPEVTNGTSWIWADYSGSIPWTSSIPAGATSSFTSSVDAGGGIWYTGSQYSASVTFTYRSDKDINLNVTNTVRAWTTSSVPAQYSYPVQPLAHYQSNDELNRSHLSLEGQLNLDMDYLRLFPLRLPVIGKLILNR